jgi:hypothetical protein
MLAAALMGSPVDSALACAAGPTHAAALLPPRLERDAFGPVFATFAAWVHHGRSPPAPLAQVARNVPTPPGAATRFERWCVPQDETRRNNWEHHRDMQFYAMISVGKRAFQLGRTRMAVTQRKCRGCACHAATAAQHLDCSSPRKQAIRV